MSRKSGRHARKNTARGLSAAIGTVAVTAALTTGSAGTAAAASPLEDTLADIAGTISLAPVVIGGGSYILVTESEESVTNAVDTFNSIPLLNTVATATSDSTNELGLGADANGFIVNLAASQSAGVDVLGLIGVSNTTSTDTIIKNLSLDDLTTLATALASGDLSGLSDLTIDSSNVLSNITSISLPLGSSVSGGVKLTSASTDGVTTFTPAVTAAGVLPLGLGGGDIEISLFTVGFSETGIIIGGPSISGNLTLLGNSVEFDLSTGQIAAGTDGITLTSPSGNVAFETLLGDLSAGITETTVTLDEDGLDVDGSVITGEVETALGGGTVTVNTGEANIGTDGASITGPTVNASVDTPIADATVGVTTGSASVDENGATITGPTANGSVTTDAGSVEGSVNTGSASVNENGATVNGPEAEVEVTTDAGSTTATADGGSASVSTDGDVDVEAPSVDVDTDTEATADAA